MTQAAVAIGGNLGDVPATIEAACTELARHPGISELHCSSLYLSAPMGAIAGETFWNAACVLETSLDPHSLLAELQRAENLYGRTREIRWGPRTLDLDLILFGDETVSSIALTVPHPEFWYRRFVLEPLSELIPDAVAPGFTWTIRQLKDRLNDRPFRLGIGGDVTIDSIRTVLKDFSTTDGIDVEVINERPSPPNSTRRFSLVLWYGPDNPHPLLVGTGLLQCEQFNPQHLRDVLAAALGTLKQV